MHEQPIPVGLCQCGCGRQTRLAPQTAAMYGWIKGEPLRFIRGHSSRKRTPEYVVEDRGYTSLCWVCTRALTSSGYGHITRDGALVLAHRWHYEQAHGAILAGLEMDHLCRVRACCNPGHLEPVTRTENMRRGLTTKLTAEAVADIRRSAADRNELGKRYGVTPNAIDAILKRRTWKDVA